VKANHALVLLRLFLGGTFAIAVYPKLAAGAQYPEILRAFLERFALANAHPFYAAFLSGTVLPNVATFGVLVEIAETFVALALITGTATRLAAIVAMFLVTNYMFAKGLWWWYPSSNDAADFMIALALIIGSAGRTFGVDALLAARFPKIPW